MTPSFGKRLAQVRLWWWIGSHWVWQLQQWWEGWGQLWARSPWCLSSRPPSTTTASPSSPPASRWPSWGGRRRGCCCQGWLFQCRFSYSTWTNTSRTLSTLVTKMNFERIPSQVLLLSHPDLRTSLRDSAECGKLVWLEEETEGGHLIKLLDRYACTATVNTLKMLRSLTTGCPCSRTMRNRAKLWHPIVYQYSFATCTQSVTTTVLQRNNFKLWNLGEEEKSGSHLSHHCLT